MISGQELARKALAAALGLRQKNGKSLVDPVCVYDLAEDLDIEVRFADIPSLEGMYSSTPRPTIIIGSERPAGRRVYTGGHELGHHLFCHGTRVDELRADGAKPPPFDPDEFLVQSFAGFLLMPKLAVCNAFTIRGWKPAEATAEQIYRISNLFGVTYTALIHHMSSGLGLLPKSAAAQLFTVKLKDVRAAFIPDAKRQLILVDTFWKGRAIDLEVGDLVLVPFDVLFEGACLTGVGHVAMGCLFEAALPGLGRVSHPASGWASYVRVSRHFYVGRSKYRHFEEMKDE